MIRASSEVLRPKYVWIASNRPLVLTSAKCDSALFWRRDGSDELDIFLGSLDRPAEVPMPQKQIWTQHRMAWVPAQREIPAFKENS